MAQDSLARLVPARTKQHAARLHLLCEPQQLPRSRPRSNGRADASIRRDATSICHIGDGRFGDTFMSLNWQRRKRPSPGIENLTTDASGRLCSV